MKMFFPKRIWQRSEFTFYNSMFDSANRARSKTTTTIKRITKFLWNSNGSMNYGFENIWISELILNVVTCLVAT